MRFANPPAPLRDPWSESPQVAEALPDRARSRRWWWCPTIPQPFTTCVGGTSTIASMDNRNVAASMFRVASLIALALLTLLYLQFGVQALFQSPPQGILSLVGSVALGWGAVRTFRRRPAAAIVAVGTVPILLFHAVYTLVDPGALPFLILSLPVPLAAGAIWLVGSRGHVP